MSARQLMRDVLVTGRNFWGLTKKNEAYLRFLPSSQPGQPTKPGIFWKPTREPEPVIQVTPDLLRYYRGRLQFNDGTYYLDDVVNLGLALPWLGANDFIIEGYGRPPYFGRTEEVWQALLPNCKLIEKRSTRTEWLFLPRKKIFRWAYPGNSNRYTEITFSSQPGLHIEMTCTYPDFPLLQKTFFVTPDNNPLPAAWFEFYKPCNSPLLFNLSRMASLCGWPHHQKTAWLGECEKNIFLERVLYNRLISLLGTLATLHPRALLAAHVVHRDSGPLADLHVVKELREHFKHQGEYT